MENLEHILNNSPEFVIFSLDENYKYLYFNAPHKETMKKIWGFDIALGKNMLDYISSPEDRIKAKYNFDRALKGDSFTLIEEYGDEKLERLYYENIYTPFYSNEGKVKGLTVLVNDISSRRREEVSIINDEKLYRTILQCSFEAILLVKKEDGSITYVNETAEKLFGYTKDEHLKNRISDYHPEQSIRNILKNHIENEKEEVITEKEILCKKKNGELFKADISSINLLIDDVKCILIHYTDISTEIENREKIKFQEDILSAIGQAIIIVDSEGRITYWNNYATQLYGWTEEEVIGHFKDEFLPVDLSEEETKIIKQRILEGQHWTSDLVVRNKSGETFPIMLTTSPFYDVEGNIQGFIGISADISERKNAENQAKRSEKLYKSIISALSEGLVVQDKNDKIIVANQSAEKILGITKEQLKGIDSYDPRWKALKEDGTLYKPEEHPSMITLRTGQAINDQIVNLEVGNGERKVISINTRPILELDGSIAGSVASFTDITERLKAQNILKESESRLKNISDSVPGAVLRYKLNPDSSYEILYLSQGAEMLWEVPKDLVLQNAKLLWDPVFSEDYEGLSNSIEISANTLNLWSHEWRIKLPDNRIKWLNGRGYPFKNKEGAVIWDSIILDITEQKKTLIQLDESQKLLESINQNINEGIYRSTVNGVIYVNNAFIKMFGFESFEELKNLSPNDIYKDPVVRKDLIKKLQSRGFFENEEVVFIRKDKSEFLGLISSRKYVDYQGNNFWDGAIRDITEERKTAKKIEESRQLLESINKNINEAIYRSINRKGLVYVNEEFVRMFGYSNVDELISGNPINLYKNPEDRKILGDELVEFGSYVNREVEFKRKDGSTFWGSISSIMINGEDGEIYFDGAIRDITVQKETAMALKKQAEMQRLLRTISSNYINLPIDKVESTINNSLKALGEFANADRAFVYDVFTGENYCVNTFEWCREDVESNIDFLQFVPLSDIPEVMHNYLSGKTVVVSDTEKLENGFLKKLLLEQKVKSTVGVPIMYNGDCVGFVGFDSVKEKKVFSEMDISLLNIFSDMMLNIRNRAQKQIELKQLLNTTTDQNKRLKDFSFMTSHNIRSSVSNLLGLTKLIMEEPGNIEYVRLLNNTAQKLDTTIKNINQLLHFESGFQTKNMQECNVREIIDRIFELNKTIIDEKNISMNINIPSSFTIKGIPAFLDSIFYNLLSNAFKYGITRNSKTIEVWAEEKQNEIVIYIRDMGWGIDLVKHKDKLFKLGSRLHISSDGQGLGLYMTKHQIEEMGGTIEIDSEVNVGTTFILHFPKTSKSIYAGLSYKQV